MECQLETITIQYELRGEGRPLLMLHGMPLDRRHMIREMEPLFAERDGWQRIYLDLPGMGQTPAPDWLVCQDQVLDVLLQFIDRVAPGRFVVAGLSYGGYLARGVVYRRAARLDGLLLTVPAIPGEAAERHLPPRTTLVFDGPLLRSLPPDLRQSIDGMAVVQGAALVEGWQAVIAPAVAAADHGYLARLRQRPALSFDPDALSAPCPVPALILTGRQDDVCGYRDAWGILENYPRATFAVLDRAGHCLTMEQEGLFRALVGEWLDRVEEYAGAR